MIYSNATMENQYQSSKRTFNENVRRVNNAIFISKDRCSSEESEAEDSESCCSMISNLTEGTLQSWNGLIGDDCNSDSSTSTIIGKIVPKRGESDPDAYQKWMKTKIEAERNRKQKELNRKKLEEIERKLAEEKRKQESVEKLKRWMERKELEKKKNQAENGNMKEGKSGKLRKKWIPNEESETTFQAWQNRVKQQEEERKLRQLAEQRMQEELKQERQYISKLVYDDWVKSSSAKPKPVPLNQGIDSLRGSISKMFINPIPWKSNID